ncbi:hypothetical protein MIMGU_mgv1a024719mg [Erythranthe guttata]|uniref:3'-5' exonuclease domain-containing protein n=1 Tax=Erythranthe guttata TaxID=4155 RepID=A0A022QY84_ERYGU|nr:hypothetical protein MIMGU_mgv1a024719mg [Erythranthe guttata]
MAMSTIEVQPHLLLVPFYNEFIHVTVAREAQQVHEWICSIYKFHNDFSKNLLIGLDTEWLPNLNPGEDHPIAILQLCIGNRCLIFQLLHRDFIPASLRAFLARDFIPPMKYGRLSIDYSTRKMKLDCKF